MHQQPAAPRHGEGAWETSAKQGEEPSPETIAHGTVRMEDHPNFDTLIKEASSKGFVITYGERARVDLVHVVDEAGELLEVRRGLHLVPGMRYLDLEHEMGHLRQLERFGDAPPPTRKIVKRGQLEKNAQGSPTSDHLTPDHLTSGHLTSGRLTLGQDALVEYHNRLQEYIRLTERKVSSFILEEHAEGLDTWRRKVEAGGLGRAGSLDAWAKQYFHDIPALEARCRELGLALVPQTSRW